MFSNSRVVRKQRDRGRVRMLLFSMMKICRLTRYWTLSAMLSSLLDPRCKKSKFLSAKMQRGICTKRLLLRFSFLKLVRSVKLKGSCEMQLCERLKTSSFLHKLSSAGTSVRQFILTNKTFRFLSSPISLGRHLRQLPPKFSTTSLSSFPSEGGITTSWLRERFSFCTSGSPHKKSGALVIPFIMRLKLT